MTEKIRPLSAVIAENRELLLKEMDSIIYRFIIEGGSGADHKKALRDLIIKRFNNIKQHSNTDLKVRRE